ncbi:MAB_1171c family putative transporter [Streptomyces sp. NPDC090077]|uniref:MAB_1171c family putative transporter n=1 Tax=Streptomyces sp. NPDC090077 TaxID=3365938 RepID=UPI003823B6C1
MRAAYDWERSSTVASGPGNLVYYVPGLTLLFVCAMKLPTLVRRRRDPLLRSAFLQLFAGGCIMLLAAPESILALNQATGITNCAAVVVYAALTTYSGASLLLIIHWRPALPEQTRRAARRCLMAYSLAVLIIVVLFWVGNAPVEQITLFDAYYANTPYIREMIVTYLLAHGVAATANLTMCWRWSTEVRGSLRTGLRLLVPAYLLHVGYDVTRLVAVSARWAGHNLDFLIGQVSPRFAALSAIIGAVGYTLPLVGPRIAQTAQAMRQLRQLTPLWRVLRNVPTPGAIRSSLPWWRTSPAMLLMSRKTALYDAMLSLTPYCDPAVRDVAYQAALRCRQDEASAAASADAAMIVVALERQHADPEQLQGSAGSSAWRSKDLIPLSLALASPVVQNLREHDRSPAESSRS